ncbi:MAG: metallophosphoesterase [Cyclobacteriaceae bacterium]
MRTFVLGDIHGADRALKQCLERSSFNSSTDRLISLGDVCDGWPESAQAMERLIQLPNITLILGNHDHMTLEWVQTGVKHPGWLSQGGSNTVDSYEGKMPEKHRQFLENAPYYLLEDDRLFVHAGIIPGLELSEQGPDTFLWDRSLFRTALDRKLGDREAPQTEYSEIYIGHSPIHTYGWEKPVQSGEVWMMDTGAGWTGSLCMMDIESKEVFCSDPVHTLYPPGSGRAG